MLHNLLRKFKWLSSVTNRIINSCLRVIYLHNFALAIYEKRYRIKSYFNYELGKTVMQFWVKLQYFNKNKRNKSLNFFVYFEEELQENSYYLLNVVDNRYIWRISIILTWSTTIPISCKIHEIPKYSFGPIQYFISMISFLILLSFSQKVHWLFKESENPFMGSESMHLAQCFQECSYINK